MVTITIRRRGSFYSSILLPKPLLIQLWFIFGFMNYLTREPLSEHFWPSQVFSSPISGKTENALHAFSPRALESIKSEEEDRYYLKRFFGPKACGKRVSMEKIW